MNNKTMEQKNKDKPFAYMLEKRQETEHKKKELNKEDQYSCPICGEKFRYKANFNRHKCPDQLKIGGKYDNRLI